MTDRATARVVGSLFIGASVAGAVAPAQRQDVLTQTRVSIATTR